MFILRLFYILSIVWTASNAIVVQKCCPDGQLLRNDPWQCEPLMVSEGSNRTDHLWWLTSSSGDHIMENRRILNIPPKIPPDKIHYGSGIICKLPFVIPAFLRTYVVSDNGTLINYNTNESYSPASYCADYLKPRNGSKAFHVYITCGFNKCCNDDQILVREEMKCVNGTPSPHWRVNIFDKTNVVVRGKSFLFSDSSSKFCKEEEEFGKMLLEKRNDFYLEKNSTVFVNYPLWKGYHAEEFCVDAASVQGKEDTVTAIILCLPSEKTKVTLLLVGAIFLFIVSLAVLMIPVLVPKLRSLIRKMVWCHLLSNELSCVAVIIFFICDPLSTVKCKLLGLMQQFTAMGEMFWLNAMCIHLALTFRNLPVNKQNQKSKNRRFIFFSLYAWGLPLFIVFVTALVEFIPESPDHPLRPFFEDYDCWFHSLLTTWVYLGIPLGLLVVINLLLSLYTLWEIICAQRKTVILSEIGSIHGKRPQDEKNWRLKLCLKLMLLTGLTYTMEIITWVSSNEVNLIFILISLFRNILIFILFYWKPKVLRKRLQEFGFCRESSESPSTETAASSQSSLF